MVTGMAANKENIHHLLHQQFILNEKAAEAARIINAAIGQQIVTVRTAQHWFKQFRDGRSTAERKKGSGRPPTVGKRVLAQRLRRNPDASPTELSAGYCHVTTTRRWLRSTGRKPKKTKWVPHALTEKNKQNRLEACLRLLRKHRRGRLLSRLVTADESWINYDGTAQKIVWKKPDEETTLTPKPDKHRKKQMLCIFWSKQGPLHWELLKPGTTIDAKKYCEQLSSLDTALKAWSLLGLHRGRMLFHHDNAPPHRSQITRRHIVETLRWELLEQPPYSPDIAPSDYYLFRSLKNFLRGKKFKKPEEVQSALEEYFASKTGTDFYKRGIKKLPAKWRKVVKSHGNYFVE